MINDTDEIIRGLERDRELLLSKYWPSWIRAGKKALLTPRFKPGQKRPTSSFVFYFEHVGRGKRNTWQRFSAGVGGGLVALLYYGERGHIPNSKDEWREAFDYCRDFLGMKAQRELTPEQKNERDREREQYRLQREKQDREDAAAAAEARAKRQMSALEVASSSVPLAGTLGEAYLVERGLPPISTWPWNPINTIRFHPSLDYEMDYQVPPHPAVIAIVQGPFGDTIAVWQIYLTPGKPQKANYLSPCKIGRGPAAGGAVRIGGDGERIGTAEGFETALGFYFLEDCRKPIWATLSTSGMRGFEPPSFVNHNSIYPDADQGLFEHGRLVDGPGIRAARDCKARMLEIGVGSNINDDGYLGDGLDLWNLRKKHEQETT